MDGRCWAIWSITVTLLVAGARSTGIMEEQEFEFSYDNAEAIIGPSSWGEFYPECNGTIQSPIIIVRANATITDDPMYALRFDGFDQLPRDPTAYTMHNNGHGVEIHIKREAALKMKATIGVNGTYFVDRIDFHWASDSDDLTPEHPIEPPDDLPFTAASLEFEIHLLLRRLPDDDLDNEENPYEMAVIAIQAYDDRHVYKYVNGMNVPDALHIITSVDRTQLAHAGYSVTLQPFVLDQLLPNPQQRFYYAYRGSLSAPPCTENVLWAVFATPIPIHLHQFDWLRTSFNAQDNMRPQHALTVDHQLSSNCYLPKCEWNYETWCPQGQNSWQDAFPLCKSHFLPQAPISIDSNRAVERSDVLSGLIFTHRADSAGGHFKLYNNGRGVQINSTATSETLLTVRDFGVYKLDRIVFHWGLADKYGSEHVVDNRFHSFEIQFFLRLQTPVETRRAEVVQMFGKEVPRTAVATVFADAGPFTVSPVFSEIVRKLPSVYKTYTDAALETFDMTSLLPKNGSSYFVYIAGLPVPPCTPNTLIIVHTQPVGIRADQIAAFREIETCDNQKAVMNRRLTNFRRLQVFSFGVRKLQPPRGSGSRTRPSPAGGGTTTAAGRSTLSQRRTTTRDGDGESTTVTMPKMTVIMEDEEVTTQESMLFDRQVVVDEAPQQCSCKPECKCTCELHCGP